jgi:hypothetical protein
MLLRVFAVSFLALLPVAGCAHLESAPTSTALRPVTVLAPKTSRLRTYSLDAPIEQIASTPNGCALLDRDFPGMRQHPMYEYFKSMSLNQVAAMSKGQITPAMMKQARLDLASLGGVTQVSAAKTPMPAP